MTDQCDGECFCEAIEFEWKDTATKGHQQGSVWKTPMGTFWQPGIDSDPVVDSWPQLIERGKYKEFAGDKFTNKDIGLKSIINEDLGDDRIMPIYLKHVATGHYIAGPINDGKAVYISSDIEDALVLQLWSKDEIYYNFRIIISSYPSISTPIKGNIYYISPNPDGPDNDRDGKGDPYWQKYDGYPDDTRQRLWPYPVETSVPNYVIYYDINKTVCASWDIIGLHNNAYKQSYDELFVGIDNVATQTLKNKFIDKDWKYPTTRNDIFAGNAFPNDTTKAGDSLAWQIIPYPYPFNTPYIKGNECGNVF